MDAVCARCKFTFPFGESLCTHCAHPGIYWNVRLAAEESTELSRRHHEVLINLADDVRAVALLLENASTVAAINRSIEESVRLACGGIYSTHYKLLEAEFRVPSGSVWDLLRSSVDTALFPNFHSDIRFAFLSADDRRLWNYGQVAWVLLENMIEHRASVFERNSVIFYRDVPIPTREKRELPKGHRATWEDRGLLCVVKLGGELSAEMDDAEVARRLLIEGETTEDDEFIEVHIFGPMTVRSVAAMEYRPEPGASEQDLTADRALITALRDKLTQYSVKFTENGA